MWEPEDGSQGRPQWLPRAVGRRKEFVEKILTKRQFLT